jgi:hypothetical protein
LENLLALLTKLAPLAATFVPQAGGATDILTAIAALMKHISEQSGMTTDEILDRAGATLDDNEKKLLADQIRLQGGTP